MSAGYVALVLHAHLPFVRHPELSHALEERWLFEAISECYLPLLEALERLEQDRVPFRLTFSLSPTLINMLDDPFLRARYAQHMRRLIDLADREVHHTKSGPQAAIAQMYQRQLRRQYQAYWRRYNGDLVSAFGRLQEAGYLELITCCATHGFLPLLRSREEAVAAQIQVAVHEYRRRFGRPPRGMWLPECGYYTGLDRLLRRHGVEYVFVDTHALTQGEPGSPYGPYAPAFSPNGVALFARDPESSKQVWSSQEGYPGDSAYRDFYRDIGWERDESYLGPELSRTFTGLKYYRVTGRTEAKELYDPEAAHATVCRHAGHFVWCREQQVGYHASRMPREVPPLVVAPYDAELFGHWWFEGPAFLEQVARQAAPLGGTCRFITPGDWLDRHSPGHTLEPLLSSWGLNGYCDYWLDGCNHWMYPQLHAAAERMAQLARAHRNQGDPASRRALNQAGRELLLAQASDWAFILKSGTVTDYANKRFRSHMARFGRITDALAQGLLPDEAWLSTVEAADNLFPELDYHVFTSSAE